MKKLIFIGTLLCTLVVRGYAQRSAATDTAYNFTLQDCINYAYMHQDSVVNAGLDIKSADYHVKEIIGQGLPQINFLPDGTLLETSPATIKIVDESGPSLSLIQSRDRVQYEIATNSVDQ